MHDLINLFNHFCVFILNVSKHIFDFFFMYHHFKSFAFKDRCDCDVFNLKIVQFQYFLAFFRNYSENH